MPPPHSTPQQCVFSNGVGANLNIDFHRSSPNNNLFTQINHGSGSRVVESSGDDSNGAATGRLGIGGHVGGGGNQRTGLGCGATAVGQ